MIPCSDLLPIQELDLRIDATLEQIKEKKAKIAKMQAEIQKDEELLKKKEALLKKIQVRKRTAETSMQDYTEKVKTAKLKMQSAGLSPSSYEALQKEIAVNSDKLSEVETQVLEDMEKVEILETDTVKGNKVISGRKQHLSEIKDRVASEITQLNKEIDALKTERSQNSLNIETSSLELYEEIRNKKGGQVIYDTESNGCPACGMGLPNGFITSLSNHEGAEKCTYCGKLLRWTGLRE